MKKILFSLVMFECLIVSLPKVPKPQGSGLCFTAPVCPRELRKSNEDKVL